MQSPRLVVSKPSPVCLSTEKDYLQMLSLSENMFVLLDLHEDWCGPTKAAIPYFNQLWIDVDDAGKRIYLASLSSAQQDLRSKVKSLCPNIDIESQGCRPLFIVIRNGHMVASIDGINPPMIDFYLKLFLPALGKSVTDSESSKQ